MNELENNVNDNTDQLGKVGEQNMEAKAEYKKLKATKVASVKPTIEDQIKSLHKRGFNIDQIAGTLMCQRSLVKQIVG